MTLQHKIAFVNHKALPWLELRLYRGLNYGLSYGRRKKEYAGLNGQVCHFNGCGSGFRALVAQSAAGAVECLLQILHGEDAEDNRYCAFGIQCGDALSGHLADVVEMWRVAAYYAAYGYDGVVFAGGLCACRRIDKFHGARHSDYLYAVCAESYGAK